MTPSPLFESVLSRIKAENKRTKSRKETLIRQREQSVISQSEVNRDRRPFESEASLVSQHFQKENVVAVNVPKANLDDQEQRMERTIQLLQSELRRFQAAIGSSETTSSISSSTSPLPEESSYLSRDMKKEYNEKIRQLQQQIAKLKADVVALRESKISSINHLLLTFSPDSNESDLWSMVSSETAGDEERRSLADAILSVEAVVVLLLILTAYFGLRNFDSVVDSSSVSIGLTLDDATPIHSANISVATTIPPATKSARLNGLAAVAQDAREYYLQTF